MTHRPVSFSIPSSTSRIEERILALGFSDQATKKLQGLKFSPRVINRNFARARKRVSS